MRQRFLLFFLLSLQIPSILASHGCSLAKGDCTGLSDDLLCPVLGSPAGGLRSSQNARLTVSGQRLLFFEPRGLCHVRQRHE